MKYLLTLALLVTMTACNYTVSMSHSEGQANDVIDSNPNAEADVSPTLDFPGAL